MLTCCVFSHTSWALTSTLVKYGSKSWISPYFPSAQSYPKGQVLFECRVLFLSTKIFVQNPCRYLCKTPVLYSNGKTYPPNTQVYSSTFHPKEIPLMVSSFPKNCFFILWAHQDTRELAVLTTILLLYRADGHAANPCFHTAFWIVRSSKFDWKFH